MKLVKLLDCYKLIKSKKAFSLVELSIVLTAASLVVVSSMYLSEYNDLDNKYQETEQKIKLIETAILAYYKNMVISHVLQILQLTLKI